MAALRRRAEAAGAYVSIARRGAEEAGAIFVSVDRRDGSFDLYGPAPQTAFDAAAASDRLFTRFAEAVGDAEMRRRIEQEIRFDPDLWVVDIEDRAGRSFVDVI